MQYRTDKYGNRLSVLGFGCMRFTKKGNAVDVDKAEKEIMAAQAKAQADKSMQEKFMDYLLEQEKTKQAQAKQQQKKKGTL